MKLSSKTIPLLFLLFFSCTKLALAQQVDLTSLDAYWKITDGIKQGDTVSREAWKSFLQLEGNHTYVDNQAFTERFLESYRKTLNFVYNPKNEARVQKMMDDKLNNWMAYKINQYRIHEKELRDYATTLKEPAYLDSLYLYCWQWLPKRLHQKTPNTKIFIIGIDNDALVHQKKVVFTLWNVYNQDKLKYGILGAHELHHVLRKARSLEATDPSEEGILYALQVILNEGSADMIDKKYSFDKSKDIVYEYHFDDLLLNKPDSIVMKLDTSMQLMAQSKGAKFMTVKDYRNLFNYTSGHNPGYYMADIIVRNGYKKALIENVQNPFYFITLYNKAAKKDKQHPPVFSDQAIAFSKVLARKYWKTGV